MLGREICSVRSPLNPHTLPPPLFSLWHRKEEHVLLTTPPSEIKETTSSSRKTPPQGTSHEPGDAGAQSAAVRTDD